MPRTSVLIVLTALALSGCATVRQDPSREPWLTTGLSPLELSEAQAAVAEVAGTRVFDWNTVAAQRSGKLLHVWVQALPEPQADGSTHEPVSHCIGDAAALRCDVHVDRSLYTQVDVRGRPQRIVAEILGDIGVAEASALASEAFEAAPALTLDRACGAWNRADAALLEAARAAFVPAGTQMPLLVEYSERKFAVSSGPYFLVFGPGKGPGQHEFDCWGKLEVKVSS